MIKNFNEYTESINEWGTHHASKNSWGRSKYLINKEEYDRFLDMKGGLCLILCDDKSVNTNNLFKQSINNIDYIYKVGEFTTEPASSAIDLNDEVMAEINNGSIIDDKILVFVNFDIPNKWNECVRPLLKIATNVIKLNTVDYSQHQKGYDKFIEDIENE